jgi:pyridoxine kinase
LSPGAALGHLQALVDASLGAPHLRIAETADSWRAAPAVGGVPAEAPDPVR